MGGLLARVVLLAFLVVFTVVGSFTAGFVTANHAPTGLAGTVSSPIPTATQIPNATPTARTSDEQIALFKQAWQLLDQEFYAGDALKKPDAVYGAIKGTIEALGDPYTSFATPRQAEVQMEDLSGKFEGIGATVEVRDGRLIVVAPEPGRPADRAGLRAGDFISQIDGKSTEGLTVTEAVSRIRGPRGSTVTLRIVRDGQVDPFDVAVAREEIKLQYVRWQMLPDKVAYLRLTQFGSVTPDFLAALKEIRQQGARKLVLDLRNNPGGYLDVSIEIASQFLEKGTVVQQEERDGKRETFAVKPGGTMKDLPMAVLVNKGSASASEIVAGALQDYQRAVLVGEKTFGKGSVQKIHTLADKSSLRITVARWFTPNGRAIHETGLEPDIAVPTPEKPPASLADDAQLQAALNYLKTKSSTQGPPAELPLRVAS
ncbi:MAG: S41 family peptidase [Chloroflexota bacterium]